MDVKKRNQVVNKHRYCVNCLAKSHDLRSCASLDTCRKCGRNHHSLLHPGIQTRLQSKLSTQRKSTINHHSKRKASHLKPQSSTKNETSNVPAVPDQRIISEAIRSLANVLCAKPSTSVPGGRNV